MNHYETLGLNPDATPDQIKAAFRRCASSAHPDRPGGSTERMQAVNRAYSVLGEPIKRERYDRTGVDDGSKSVEDMALELLQAAFEAALDADSEPVQYASERLAGTKRQLVEAKHGMERARATLDRRSGKTKAKGKNLVQAIIERKLGQLKQQAAQIEEALAANAKAVELLAEYEGEPQPNASGMQFDKSYITRLKAAQYAGSGYGTWP